MKKVVLASLALVLTLGVFATDTEAVQQCHSLICPDFGNPVTCEDGGTYRNQCEASKACQENCF